MWCIVATKKQDKGSYFYARTEFIFKRIPPRHLRHLLSGYAFSFKKWTSQCDGKGFWKLWKLTGNESYPDCHYHTISWLGNKVLLASFLNDKAYSSHNKKINALVPTMQSRTETVSLNNQPCLWRSFFIYPLLALWSIKPETSCNNHQPILFFVATTL